MVEGKCKEFGCNTPTKLGKTGKPYDYCWNHSEAKKKTELPIASAQEKEKEIFTVFKDFLSMLKLEYPQMDAAEGLTLAISLTDQYWKNERTPR